MPAVKWTIGERFEQVRVLTKNLVEKLRSRQADGAMKVGMSVLANVQESYTAKARGGMGSDGIVWRSLKPATIRARMNRLKAFRKLKKGTKRKKINAIVSGNLYEIGVDTGLQVNSASPGFTDPNHVWYRDATDNLGANLYTVNAGNVAIAYDRSYSGYFDAERKLIPETLPDPWRIEAEGEFVKWADLIVNAGDN